MKTFLDWSAYKDAGMGDAYADIPKHGGDFAKAVAVCINSGQCETLNKLVMCPSYKVSGNPRLSTGGRVKLLKAALSDDFPEHALANPELAEAMALCVSCKGCKRECEANIDMPLIRAEYLAQQNARKGVSRRGRLFAHLPRWLHDKPWLKSLVRLRNRLPVLRKLSDAGFGLSAWSTLPEPAARPYNDKVATVFADADLPEVVVLVDTFARHFEPAIAEAAITVLQTAGYAVHIATPAADVDEPGRPLCCGRTYLAQGLIKEARAEAQRLVASLMSHVEAGRIVVGLEASCVLGLRDDAKALGLGADLQKVAANVLLFEEFLAKEIKIKRWPLPLKAPFPVPTLVHGHCHQKAVGAMKSMRRVLKSVEDHDFSLIEAGCCGMAGTFGLEAEHAEMSACMAESELMPALRARPEATVLANGFSCRQQMRNLGDPRPQHLAEFLAAALSVDIDDKM